MFVFELGTHTSHTFCCFRFVNCLFLKNKKNVYRARIDVNGSQASQNNAECPNRRSKMLMEDDNRDQEDNDRTSLTCKAHSFFIQFMCLCRTKTTHINGDIALLTQYNVALFTDHVTLA